jgi:hypothetical protein
VSLKYHAMTPPLPAPAASASSDISPEAAIRREIAKLGEWLTAQGLDLTVEPAHADHGSRDRLYWRYGYFLGLTRALAVLTSTGTTLH